jgi:glutamate/tyrosine decarboxylase-like PLP-dependent enzyme
VDGAYGGFAAAADDVPEDIHGISDADSVAVDPHKWLYAPLEAGCVLVRDPQMMRDAFSYHPVYFHFKKDEGINFVDFGLQNSRGFRALKVWLALKQVGREGYRRMINEDIQLSKYMFRLLEDHENFEVFTQNLSIATFRYVPSDLKGESREEYLNELNEAILFNLENSGELYLSNAVIDGRFLLRACGDVEAMPEIIARYGKEVDTALRADMEKSNK